MREGSAKGIPEVLVGAAMSLYGGGKTIMRVDSMCSETFWFKLGRSQ